mmetsp:Transcript_51577/g.99689  ORF Transcript_51577/g.99689 Transcript_51577/m.99689 type:complete len:262 (+) Transcript_51577:41-826(+)
MMKQHKVRTRAQRPVGALLVTVLVLPLCRLLRPAWLVPRVPQRAGMPLAPASKFSLEKPPKVARPAVSTSTMFRQLFHCGRYVVMWKEKWIGPANLDRAALKITGMDTYAVVAAVLLQVILGLYTSVPEPSPDDPKIRYPRLQRIVFEVQMVLLMGAVLCSTYTMVTFLLVKIYTVTSLGLYRDVSYDLFFQGTQRLRLTAFWSLIGSMYSFLIAFALNLYTRIKGNRGLLLAFFGILALLPIVRDWMAILGMADRFLYQA